jgi:hypothetical protein
MTTPQPAVLQARFAALAVPNSRRYVCGQALSLIGAWVETALGLAAACLAAVITGGWAGGSLRQNTPNRE